MAESAEQALYEILNAHFGAVVSPIWTDYQPLESGSASLVKPYLVYFVASAVSERQVVQTRHERITLSTKGVALELASALAIQEVLSQELDDSGSQDYDPRLPSHTDWEVLTVTEDGIIRIDEALEGAKWIYHRGHRFDILMERK
jgi:hypothetical protein